MGVKLLHFLEPLVFPGKCLKCGRYRDAAAACADDPKSCFCDACLKQGLFPIEPPYCRSCGLPLSSRDDTDLCRACQRTPLDLGRVRAAAEYRGLVKDGIHMLKYQSKLSIARFFEHLLFQTFVRHYADTPIDLIIPLPLHPGRMRKRGFNQAYFLSRNFETLYRNTFDHSPPWKLDFRVLNRIKKTRPQTGFDIEKRKDNVRQAFKARHPERILGKRILLIDDVLTTGASCNEAARALLEQGAVAVDALVLARA